jgi:predicted small metal-binding protein
MVKIMCADYGFECDFVIKVDSQDSLEKFGTHMNQIHGINYQKESLMTMLTSKLNKKS